MPAAYKVAPVGEADLLTSDLEIAEEEQRQHLQRGISFCNGLPVNQNDRFADRLQRIGGGAGVPGKPGIIISRHGMPAQDEAFARKYPVACRIA